jgi:uncharacterized protein YdhG (YjbR/CyaY superfamily)
MQSDRTIPRTVDEYIAGFPDDVRKALKRMRSAIRRAAPDAREAISRIVKFRAQENLERAAAKAKKKAGRRPRRRASQ